MLTLGCYDIDTKGVFWEAFAVNVNVDIVNVTRNKWEKVFSGDKYHEG